MIAHQRSVSPRDSGERLDKSARRNLTAKRTTDLSNSKRHFGQEFAAWAQHAFVGAQQVEVVQHSCGG
jgi:hypothetical protein